MDFDNDSWKGQLKGIISNKCDRNITVEPNKKNKVRAVINDLKEQNDVKKYKAFIALWKLRDPAKGIQFEKNLKKRIKAKNLEATDNDY